VPDRERLQKGGPKRAPRAGTMSFSERIKHLPTWNKQRRAAKKRRLAAMSRKRRIWRRVGILGTWVLAIVAAIMVITVVLFYTLTNVPRPEDLSLPQVATITYSDGSPLARFGNQDRTIVSLKQVPAHVRWEVLAAEDRGYYSEPGVSIRGTLRAAVSDLTGGDTQGGSGITQQYVKNAYLNDSRSLSRKLKELMIAMKLSRQYSKDQILEYYLNTVYFGRGVYGIQAAAEAYFGVAINRITVAQGAVLAALLRAPSFYDPANNPNEAKQRWQYVIDGMVQTKHLTAAQASALKYPTAIKPRDTQLGATGWAYLIEQKVIAELAANGISQDDILKRGLTIKTTLDHKAQTSAVSAIQQTFANLTPAQRNMKNALVAVNPKTGGILAYYGGPNGKGYNGKVDNNDYAGDGFRPPGSSFKPYTLATALTATLNKTPGVPHYTLDSRVDGSQCVIIEGRQICNDPSDAQFSSSSIPLKQALVYSLNTTFDQTAEKVGPDEVAKTAHAAGVSKTVNGKPTLVNSDGQTGFGIGIGDYPVHPVDQAVGFATFANNGVANGSYFVQTATASDGSVVYKHLAHPNKAMDPRVANDVTLAMEPIAGFSSDALDNGRASAAKTGTEGIGATNRGGNSDAWMVGFTPQVSAAVWVGSGNSTTPIVDANGNPEYGRDLPGRTWATFMNSFLAGQQNLPLPTTQMVHGGDNVAPTVTRTPTKSATPTPTPSRTVVVPPPVPTPTPVPTSTGTCTPTVFNPCVPPGGGGGTTTPPGGGNTPGGGG
jgi:membrane peptidoglycan carboxypeptidase